MTNMIYGWETNTIFEKTSKQNLDFKTENFRYHGSCVADFATLSDKRRSRSKISLLFDMNKRTLRFKI